jgi:hypothetical protein
MSDAENVLAQVRALHKPYYEHNDKRIEHTVLVYCGDHAAPCDGTDDEPCAESKDGEHEAPACAAARPRTARPATTSGPAGQRRSSPLWTAPMFEPLIDPDCRSGKHASCVGGPCECDCHREAVSA